MKVIVVGAGVGGLACAVRLAAAGHRVQVLEAGPAPGGKCAEVRREGFRFDAGPSLLTLPQVFRDLFGDTGAPLEDALELLRVEPVTEYRFADGSAVALSADLPRAVEALEAWSPGTGRDWMRFLATCTRMWKASDAYLGSLGLWPPRRPGPGEPTPRPLDALRVAPHLTLRGLARAHTRDPRLAMIIERFATYAGGDPRRSPAALALAGYVEHAFGAWLPRGGMYRLVETLVARLAAVGGQLELSCPVRAISPGTGSAWEVITDRDAHAADIVVSDIDELALRSLVRAAGQDGTAGTAAAAAAAGTRVVSGRGRARRRAPERSLSGLTLLLGLRGRTADGVHHRIRFPADYDAEFDDIFTHRRPVRDPTLYVSSPVMTDPRLAPEGHEAWLVLANAPARGAEISWEAAAEAMVDRLGVRDRIVTRVLRTPADLERGTGAVGGAIYGRAPHGRMASLRRPGNRVPGFAGIYSVGGTVHPGGGLPMVTLGAANVARAIGPA